MGKTQKKWWRVPKKKRLNERRYNKEEKLRKITIFFETNYSLLKCLVLTSNMAFSESLIDF